MEFKLIQEIVSYLSFVPLPFSPFHQHHFYHNSSLCFHQSCSRTTTHSFPFPHSSNRPINLNDGILPMLDALISLPKQPFWIVNPILILLSHWADWLYKHFKSIPKLQFLCVFNGRVEEAAQVDDCCIPASSAPFFDIATMPSFDIATMPTIVENGTTSQRKTIPRVAHKSSPCVNSVNDKVTRLCINRGCVFSNKYTKKE